MNTACKSTGTTERGPQSQHSRPRVSYVVASYNHRPYIQQCIDSILDQTYGDIELIVVDDTSTDGTREFLRDYSKARNFRYIENVTNLGAARTFNTGLEASMGDYVGVLASDDWIAPDKVAKQVAFLESTGADIALGPVIQFDSDTGSIRRGDLGHLEMMFARNKYLEHLYQTDSDCALIQSGLFKGSALRTVGFHPDYKSDDWLLVIRMLQAGFRPGLLNEPLTFYRIHGTNSHRRAEFCLNELQLPVIRDFIPPEYHPKILSNVYHTASAKLVSHERARSLKFQVDSIRHSLNVRQVAIYIALLTNSLPGGKLPFRLAQRGVRTWRGLRRRSHVD